MNIQFHYFVIKTLADNAGFSEEESQTIAYYSQQVDDYTKHLPMCVEGEPSAYFTEHGYAKKLTDKLWIIMPHPTGIDVLQSLEKHYRHTTLEAFHFLPAKSMKELESAEDFTRADYRCVQASDEKAELIRKICEEAVSGVQEEKSEKNLMCLGMALHSYADTYAHCGYSGLKGWENKAVIKKSFNQVTQEEDVSTEEKIFYMELPHIGHANAGGTPDVCADQIDVALQEDEEDSDYSKHIERDNLDSFLECARNIMEFLCDASGTSYTDDDWEALAEKLSQAMPVEAAEEKKREELAEHWQMYFPDITYEYKEDSRFYSEEAERESTEENRIVYHVTQSFYDYNELSYNRAETVLGTADMLEVNKMLLEETMQEIGNAGKMQSAVNKAADSLEKAAGENGDEEDWEPDTALGLAVQAAGFLYSAGKDIICSSMNNVQRTCGYCRGYDEAAVGISSVIDSEPIYFYYDNYEWLLELWKGQYGIETGCEIGLYYREADKEETALEKLTGKLYECVPDERRIDMSFSLKKDGEELFERDLTTHWWLTGFEWGVFSQPEQLIVSVELRFTTAEMKQAFLTGSDDSGRTTEGYGLKAMGYSWEDVDDQTVKFEYNTPYSTQPAIREKMRQSIQSANSKMVDTYNSLKEKYSISSNDPDEIDRVLTKEAGIIGKALYEKIMEYFHKKANLEKDYLEACEAVCEDS